MITGHEKFKVPDENKTNEMVWEVNWNPYDERTNNCKMLRITFPGGLSALVKKEHLHAILFAIGTEAEQRKLIPQVKRTSRWYETVVSVKAKKDIKVGENITFPLKLSLPTQSEEVIAEVKKDIVSSINKQGVKNFFSKH